MSKGDNTRPHNKAKYDSEFERIFGKRALKLWLREKDNEQKKCTPCRKQEQGECPGPTPS
jgi:hypothetical protein